MRIKEKVSGMISENFVISDEKNTGMRHLCSPDILRALIAFDA